MTNDGLNKASQIVFMLTCLALVTLASIMVWRLQPVGSGQVQRASETMARPLEPGTKLGSINGMDFQKAPVTVALVLQSQCPYCAASVPFYRRLVEMKKSTAFQLVVASLESTSTTTAYLKDKGLEVDAVSSLKPGEMSTPGTPTLIVIDRKGIVLDSWIGQLGMSQEQAVVSRISSAAKS
jgi:hypothetical protein